MFSAGRGFEELQGITRVEESALNDARDLQYDSFLSKRGAGTG